MTAGSARYCPAASKSLGPVRWTSPVTPACRVGSTCTCISPRNRTRRAYEERFRLDSVDFAFRAVGYAEKTLRAGFTTVRDLGGEVTLKLRDAINAGLVKGPRIYAAGKSIATTGGHADPTNGMNSQLSFVLGPPGPTQGVINGPDEARQAVRQRYKDGSDVIKITATGGVLSYAKSADAPQFMADEIRAIVETARDYGYTVAAHAHGKEGMKRAIEGGVTSVEHGTFMDDEIMALMKQHGTWYVPTITAGRFVAEKAKVPGYLPDIVRPKAERIGAQIQDTFAQGLQGRREDRLRHRHGRRPARRQRSRVRLHGRGRHAGGTGAAGRDIQRSAGARRERHRPARARLSRRRGRGRRQPARRYFAHAQGRVRDEGRRRLRAAASRQ